MVEETSGTIFDDYLKEHVLRPGGMYNSDFRYFKISDSLKTSPHSKTWATDNIYVRETYPYTREHAPSSTLNSSAKELANWMVSVLRSLETNDPDINYGKMWQPTFNSYEHIGLGFQLGEIDGYNKIGHYGGDKGFRSYLMMIPAENLGLVVLANCDYNEDFRDEILHAIAKLMLANAKKHGNVF